MDALWQTLMRRALELAARGRGSTSPNPMVGAVIVRDGVVIGEGWHHRAGQPHAEIEALKVCAAPRGATMIVTLEPCCHSGRTGPCTKAIIAAGIERVIVGALDPNPLVAGNGIAELRAAGIEVTTGVMREEAERLNRAFAKWIVTRRPWLTLKLAVSLDGRIAARPGERTEVTGEASRRRVQEMRAAADAVMIGAKTALVDRPRLTVRDPGSIANQEFLPPWRILVDARLEVPTDTPMLSPDLTPGAIVACALAPEDPAAAARRAHGVEVLSLPDGAGRVDLTALESALGAMSPAPLTSILCEGGGVLAAGLLSAGLVDEIALFLAPRVFGAAGVAAVGALAAPLAGFAVESLEQVGDDVLLSYDKER